MISPVPPRFRRERWRRRRTSEVLFNNKTVDAYHYDATLEYPYTVGCYHGTPAASPPMP
jgi:hypothetical protein